MESGTETSQNSKAPQVLDPGELLEMPTGGSAAAVLGWEKGPGGAAGLAGSAVPGRKPFVCRQGNKEVLETAIPCSFSLLFPATDPRAPVFTSSLPLCSAAKQPR